MVGAHQNLNGLRHLTTPPFGNGLSSAGQQLLRLTQVSNSTHYEDTKGNIKYRIWCAFG